MLRLVFSLTVSFLGLCCLLSVAFSHEVALSFVLTLLLSCPSFFCVLVLFWPFSCFALCLSFCHLLAVDSSLLHCLLSCVIFLVRVHLSCFVSCLLSCVVSSLGLSWGSFSCYWFCLVFPSFVSYGSWSCLGLILCWLLASLVICVSLVFILASVVFCIGLSSLLSLTFSHEVASFLF